MKNQFVSTTGKFGQIKGKKADNVLFIQPPTVDDTPLTFQEKEYQSSMSRMGELMGDQPGEAPIGLLYIGSYLRKEGISVKLIDFNQQDLEIRHRESRALSMNEIKASLTCETADIIAITCMTTQEDWLIKIANMARELHPEALIIAGGTHPSYQAQSLLKKCKAIDVIAIGEGEKTMLELAMGNPMKDIRGIVFRNDDGDIVSNPSRPLLTAEELDTMPFPAYDLLSKHAFPFVPRVLTARGCIGRCPFCIPNKMFGNRLRNRNPEKVVDEIEWLINGFDVRTDSKGTPFILIGDLTFGSTPKSMEMCEKIIARNISINWWCQTRSDTINNKKIDLKKMYQAGCRYIAIGLESASPLQLKRSHKGTTSLQSKIACSKAKDAGLIVQGYFIVGLPGETSHTALKTIDMIDELTSEEMVDLTHISMAVPYPGTSMFKDKKNYKLITNDFREFKMGTGERDGGVPPYDMPDMTRSMIYSMWLLAMSTAAKNYRNRFETLQTA